MWIVKLGYYSLCFVNIAKMRNRLFDYFSDTDLMIKYVQYVLVLEGNGFVLFSVSGKLALCVCPVASRAD